MAVYATSSRLLQLMAIPASGFGMGLVPVVGAAVGMGDPERSHGALMYSLKLVWLVDAVLIALTMACADNMALMFGGSDGMRGLLPSISEFLRVSVLFLPAGAAASLISSALQGHGLGTASMATTLTASLAQVPACAISLSLWPGAASLASGLGIASVVGAVAGAVILRRSVGDAAASRG